MQLNGQKTSLNHEALSGKCLQITKIRKRLSLKQQVLMGVYYRKYVLVHAITAYGANSFSTSALDGSKANFTTGRYSPRQRAPVPNEEKVGWVAESIRTLRLAPDGNQTTKARSSVHSVVSILPQLCRLRDITIVFKFWQ
jgi:hypothetical protein